MKFSEEDNKKLEKLGVGLIYFFGSRVQGLALDHTDYDIGVVFVDSKKITVAETFSSLYDTLNQYFPDTFRGPKLDISFLQQANPALAISAIKYGQVIFEINPTFRANFEEIAIQKYDDYLPIKKSFEEATLKAFS